MVSQLLEDPYRECPIDEDSASTTNSRAAGASYVSPHRTCTSPYILVLKQWNDSWGPEMEFRCFICSNELIGKNEYHLISRK